jgi:hypothetical protein
MFGSVVLGAAGGVVGAAIGAANSSERWRELPVEDLRNAARP